MANLSHCAELTNFRLNLWRLPAAKRPKSPMPPALAVRAKGHDLDQWPHSDMLLALTEQAARPGTDQPTWKRYSSETTRPSGSAYSQERSGGTAGQLGLEHLLEFERLHTRVEDLDTDG